MPSTSLRQRSRSAVLWSGLEVFMRQGVQFAIAIVLARMLGPSEFGTIALLYLFTGISQAFIDSGFSAALVQRQDTDHVDESTVFWFNLGMGLLVAILLILVAPVIAKFYGEPVLVPLTAILALSLFVNALGSIHQTLLTKQLDFRTPMKIGVTSTLVAGVAAILLAHWGFGVWALAVQALVASLVMTSMYWLMHEWRPMARFSLVSARRLFGFGGYLMIAGLLDVAYNRLYSLLIGKMFGVRDLGLYNRADTTKQIPVEMMSGILARVTFPLFSATHDNEELLKRNVRHALRSIMLVNLPTMLGLMVTAKSVLRVVFGEQWEPAAPFLQVLCLAGVFWPLHVINLTVLKALGHSKLFFRLEVAKKVLGTLLLMLGLTQGLIGLAWSQVVFGLLAFFINAHYTGRYLQYGAWRQILDFLPTLVTAASMATLVHFAGDLVVAPIYLSLLIQIIAGVAIFLLVAAGLPLGAYRDAVSFIFERKTALSNR